MKKRNLSEEDIDKLIAHLSASAQGPKGKYTADETYPTLQKRLFAKSRKRFSLFRFAAAAAAIALVVSLSTYLYTESSPQMIVVTTSDHLQDITLPDGSYVTLSHYSSLEYPEKFGKGKRNVTLTGEGYFDVTKDKSHPFIVSADQVEIEVLGTQFNVQSYPKNEFVKTTLLEGSVAVSNRINEGATLLVPNESAIFYKQTGVLDKKVETEAQNEISWREGKHIFNDKTLCEITDDLSNYFNRQIEITNPHLKTYKLTARFEKGETLEEIMDILQSAAGFTWREKDNNLIISKTN